MNKIQEEVINLSMGTVRSKFRDALGPSQFRQVEITQNPRIVTVAPHLADRVLSFLETLQVIFPGPVVGSDEEWSVAGKFLLNPE